MKPVALLAAGILLMATGSGYAIWIGHREQDGTFLLLGMLALVTTVAFGTITGLAFARDRRHRRR